MALLLSANALQGLREYRRRRRPSDDELWELEWQRCWVPQLSPEQWQELARRERFRLRSRLTARVNYPQALLHVFGYLEYFSS